MARLYVIQTGQTRFETEGRLDSAVGAPLTEEGCQQVRNIARSLQGQEISVVYCGQRESERQTADLLKEQLRVKEKIQKKLQEIDYGLWQGLTVEEIKRRQPKIYRLWTHHPTDVCPPGGESLQDMEQRLRHALRDVLKKHKKDAAALVLRPVAMGLLRCILKGEPAEALWDQVDPEFTWSSYDTNGQRF
ncbi:MAG: histidine phosphatase family protein [Phycisphaerae bacterium]